MARNKKLELDSVGIGKWMTSDGRFAVVRRLTAINPMEVSFDLASKKDEKIWKKIKLEYSIHSFEDYNGPKEFMELAPEVGRVSSFNQAYPWLGQYTGEGSFEKDNPELITAKTPGVKNGIVEAVEVLSEVFGDK